MNLTVIKMYFDGEWECLNNDIWEYKGGKATAFCISRNATFEEFITELYEVLGKSPDLFAINVKTYVKSSHPQQVIDTRPIPVLDDRMLRVVMQLNIDPVNYGCTPIYVTTSPKVSIEPTLMSSTETSDFQHGSPYKESKRCINSPVGDVENVHQFHEFNEPSSSVPIAPSPGYKECSKAQNSIDPLQLKTTIVPSDWVSPDFLPSSCDIFVGQLFSTKKELYTKLSNIAIRDKFQFKVYKSTTIRYEVRCASEACAWRLRATRPNDYENVKWIVRRCDTVHICQNDIFHNGHRQASSRIIGELIKRKFIEAKRIYTPKDIISDLKNDYSIDVPYHQAYRGREEALKLIRGETKESYNLLPKYSYILKEVNPGTDFQIALDENDNFLYYFLALGSCIKGFMQFIRPVIAVDGTHLSNKYKGTMLVATSLDGNNHIFPIGIGIVNSENDDSWEWFMTCLRAVIGDVPELVFISDRCSSIQKAVYSVFPSALHGLCFYHLEGNLKSHFKNEGKLWKYSYKPAFLEAVKMYEQADFEKQMEGMWHMHAGASKYLEEVGVNYWARSHFEGRRYGILTTNIAESINALLKEPRKFPVTQLVEHFRQTMQQWFYDRKKLGESMTTRLTTWAQKIYEHRRDIAGKMQIINVSEYQYQVRGGGKKDAFVDMSEKKCSCRVFQLDQFVCDHAIAVCLFLRIDPISLCSHFYTKEAFVASYSQPVIPVGEVDSWILPEDVRNQQINPPLVTSSVGRRRTRRIPSRGEDISRKSVICSRCKEIGHNRKTCKNPLLGNPN